MSSTSILRVFLCQKNAVRPRERVRYDYAYTFHCRNMQLIFPILGRWGMRLFLEKGVGALNGAGALIRMNTVYGTLFSLLYLSQPFCVPDYGRFVNYKSHLIISYTYVINISFDTLYLAGLCDVDCFDRRLIVAYLLLPCGRGSCCVMYGSKWCTVHAALSSRGAWFIHRTSTECRAPASYDESCSSDKGINIDACPNTRRKGSDIRVIITIMSVLIVLYTSTMDIWYTYWNYD